MIITPHTMVGLAIGATVSNPFVAVPLAFIAHYAGDVVPHWDFYDKWPTRENFVFDWRPVAMFLDFVLGLAIGIFFTLHALWLNQNGALALNMFLCGIAGVLPDAAYVPVTFAGSKNKIFVANAEIQKRLHFNVGPLWGNLSQVGVVIACSLVLANSLGL